jgi:putative DNA methylase
MGASIHINGTGSSVIDTIIVSRKPPVPPELASQGVGKPLRVMLDNDRAQLKLGGIETTVGDERCILFGHAARAAIQCLASTWRPDIPTSEKLATAQRVLEDLIRSAEITEPDRHLGESVAEIIGTALL